MEKALLLGDEAIALGAIHAGLSGVYAYPGTPSTEITEFIQSYPLARERGIHSDWSANEKTAMEAALGMSYGGGRALVCMKHVGMNVAADAFVNSAFTGAHGGVVVVAADDPSMHSSQNEQDSRCYGRFAGIPIFEPSNQQEAYDMTAAAFDFSEKHRVPVLLRIPTRLAHSRAVVRYGEPRQKNGLSFPDKPKQWVLMPANSRVRYVELLAQQEAFEKEAETADAYFDGPDKSTGIIAAGIGYNYVMENYPDGCPHPLLKVTQYPLPKERILKMAAECETLLIVEDGQPFIEQEIEDLAGNLRGVRVRGRLTGDLPRTGELTPDTVRKALGLPGHATEPVPEIVVPRPPALCQGCSHRDMYAALNDVLCEYAEPKVFSDIGCYTLGSLPPFRAIHSCVDMGASITMAKGAADMGVFPSVAVIGDSTFTHSGMTGLLDCVNANSNVVVVISDNLTTAMTGGQDSPGTGRLEQICRGIGVEEEHIRVVVPLPKNAEEMRRVIREEIEYKGVSVVIPRRECIQTAKRHAKK